MEPWRLHKRAINEVVIRDHTLFTLHKYKEEAYPAGVGQQLLVKLNLHVFTGFGHLYK